MSESEPLCGIRFPIGAPEDPQGPCILVLAHPMPHHDDTSYWYDPQDPQ